MKTDLHGWEPGTQRGGTGRPSPGFGPTPQTGFPPLPAGEGSKAANLGK